MADMGMSELEGTYVGSELATWESLEHFGW